MGIFHYFWKVWLRINRPGIAAKNDCFAEVSTENLVKDNNDIAERLIMEDVDVNYNTLMYVINQYGRVIRDMVCEGYSVRTGNVLFTPRISGEWEYNNMEFQPDRHKRIVDCTLTSEMRHALDVVGIQVLGLKDASYYISRITDMKTGVVNGIISCNSEIIIEGQNIKAMAEDGSFRRCIYLVKENGETFDIAESITVNEPDRIVMRTPVGLEKGDCHLVIHTYYSEGGKSNTCGYFRCIEFDKKLIIM